MSGKDNSGPAFPQPLAADPDSGRFTSSLDCGESGMTLRDYFAAKAMHQFLAGAVIPPGYDATEAFESVGQRAYQMADAMLKARQA